MSPGWLPRSNWRRRPPNPAVREMDDLCRELVFYRDEYRCWRCELEIPEVRLRKEDEWPWYPGFHWMHIFGRGRGSMRHNPDNSVCACADCHGRAHDNRFAHQIMGEFQEMFPDRFAELEILAARKVKKLDRPSIREGLQHQYNRIHLRTMAYRGERVEA